MNFFLMKKSLFVIQKCLKISSWKTYRAPISKGNYNNGKQKVSNYFIQGLVITKAGKLGNNKK